MYGVTRRTDGSLKLPFKRIGNRLTLKLGLEKNVWLMIHNIYGTTDIAHARHHSNNAHELGITKTVKKKSCYFHSVLQRC